MDVTESQLAGALEGFRLGIHSDKGGGDGRGNLLVTYGTVADADALAEALHATLSRMAALREPATATTSRGTLPHWTEITRDELAAFLAKLRVGIGQQEDWKMGTTAMLSRPQAVADAIASHSHGLRLNEAAEQDDVVDAHICCEHIAEDPEVSAMAHIVRLMEAQPLDAHAVIRALYPLNGPALPRVLHWFLARFPAPDDLPF